MLGSNNNNDKHSNISSENLSILQNHLKIAARQIKKSCGKKNKPQVALENKYTWKSN